MTAAVIEGKGVIKTLGEGATRVHALRGVDISLQPGELTLLMGPSGSGKTTLLSILGCVLSASEGSITVAGEETNALGREALAAIRRDHVGFVFQSYHLFPTLTAQENVQLVLDVRGERHADVRRRAREALAAVGIAHKANSFPAKLSGGEQQRVAIARALVGNPSAILADEPTAALDSENGHAVMEVLRGVAHSGERAVLAVTHDPRTVPFADRIIRIEDGRIVGEERPAVNRNIKFAILAVLAAMVGLPFALLAVVTSFNIGAASAQVKADNAVRWSAAAPGRIEPRTGEYRVGAVTLGRISEVRVKAGDKVAAGDVLVKLDDAEISARLSAALADVALKKFTRDDQGPTAKLKRRYDADDAVFDAEQRQVAARAALDTAQEKGGSTGDIEKAKNELAAAEAALPKLRAMAKEVKDEAGAPKPNQYETALIAAQSQVAVVRALLDQTRIRAPIAGTVLQVAAKVGDTASPSNPDALVVIGDLASLRVRTEIDARDVARVKSGQKVTIRSDAFRDQEFAGHVVSIARGLTTSRLSPRGPRRPGDTEILEAFVAFDGEVPLRSGMRVDVYFAADEAAKQ